MTRKHAAKDSAIPDAAVLLIPEPEDEGSPPPYGIKPGYYDRDQMLHLVDLHKNNADAIQFIADMLETGNPVDDGFADLLRTKRADPAAIAWIVQTCKEDASS
jgi:hypothetical protein